MLILDRFEGEWAVIEFNNTTFNIPIKLIPKEAKEGDVLMLECSINKKETENRRKKVQGLMDELFD
jgi:hypothetical protein